MDYKPVTLKELALKLKMSISTVSKALNNYPTINEYTRARVQEMAKALNYIPNQGAIHFKQKTTRTIGVILPTLIDQFYTLTIGGIEEYAMSHDYNVIICQSHEDLEREKDLVEVMKRNRVDGLIVSVTKYTTTYDHFKQLEHMGIPVIFMARHPTGYPAHTVTCNVTKAAFDAVSLLIQKGHTRIAHIMGPDALKTSTERNIGYSQALNHHGISYDSSLVKESNLSKESNQQAIQSLLDLKEHAPTAILAFKEYIIFDAVQYMKRIGHPNYKKIDFIGFGNFPLIEYLDTPPYASIEQRPEEIGKRALQLLLELIGKDKQYSTYQRIQLDCEIVIH